MFGSASFYVVLDSNVWVAERLLQTSMGSALLYALTSAGGMIGLPQIVEMELSRVLVDQAENAVQQLQKNVRLLRQLSGLQMKMLSVPNPEAIVNGIAERWKSLEGLLTRVPFTHDHSMSALNRIIAKSPPSFDNNEQFRDCCIWEAAIDLSASTPVHLISNDSAFYEGRDGKRGLASPLANELKERGLSLRVHTSLRDFLDAMSSAIKTLNENEIGKAIIEALEPRAVQLADKEILGPPKTRIRGYTTPKSSMVAISFEVSYKVTSPARHQQGGSPNGIQRIEGVCSYDPSNGKISELEIKVTSQSAIDYNDNFGGRTWYDPRVQDEYERHLRLID